MKKTLTKPIVGILIVFSLFYILYCNSCMIELPHLTWFDQLPLADLYFSNQLSLSDLFSRYGEHGLLASNMLYILNITLFHGTTLFDVFVNDLIVILCGFILAYCTASSVESKRLSTVIIVGESLFMFSCIQGSSGAMETQVRLGLFFFLTSMVFVDKALHSEDKQRKSLSSIIILILLSINVFGTLYSFAGVPLIWAITIGCFIKNRKINKKHLLISSVYLASIPLYLMEYGFFSHSSASLDNFSVGNMLNPLLHPIDFIKSLFGWCANGVLGWAYHESQNYKPGIFLVVGAITLCIVLTGIFIFFHSKMYENTWLPLMGIIYGFGVFFMVYLGRSSSWDWFSNEWYTVHLKLMMASAIWIFGYSFIHFHYSKKVCAIIILCPVLLCAFVIAGNIYGVKRAPSIHSYYQEKQKYLFVEDPSYMPVNENGETPLLHTLDITMKSIEILKKYNLSVYQYWDSYQKSPSTTIPGNAIKYIDGRYDDGWVEKNVSFQLNTLDSTEIKIDYTALTAQEVTIWVGDVPLVDKVQLKVGSNSFTIPVSSNTTVIVKLQSNHVSQLSEIDIREASFLISSITRL